MAESNNAIISTAKLTKVFRDFWLREKVTAVADLDLEIRTREVFGLLGPNGSGKSTTLKMILGLLFPTRGRISVMGKRPTDVRIKSRIGFLPEESYLYPFLNAHETLDYYGRLFHQPRRERLRRTGMLLEMVGLTSVAYRRIGEYSKGMQRRIGLAQSLINDPDLLILDEPTSGMDPVGTSQFKELIRTLALRGKTVLLSSHLLADVEDVCDRVCILYGGRQRALGSIDDLLAQQEFTQIKTRRLTPQMLVQIRRLLENAGQDILEVTTPRDKLEALFLRIVDEAQRQRLATGGAVATGQLAEFLREGTAGGRQLIEQLVAGAREEALPAAGAPVTASPARPRTEVLEELVTAAEEPGPEAPVPPVVPAGGTGTVDRAVLDELTDNGPEEG